MTNKILHQIFHHPAKNWTILCHTKPDADTIGAAMVAFEVFQRKGREVKLVCKDDPLSHYLPLTKGRKFERDLGENPILAVDTGGIETTGFEKEIIAHPGPIYCIDHHRMGKPFAHHEHRDEGASSTCEIVYTLLAEAGEAVSKEMADLLLAGILHDTDYFRHACTSERTLKVAAELIERGARIPKLAKTVVQPLSTEILRLWGKVLKRVRLHEPSKTVWGIIDDKDFTETGISKDQLELGKLMFIINSINESDFSLILSQTDSNLIKGSLRSDEKKANPTDVSKIASHYGGGGHQFASGFKMPGKLVKEGEQWKIVRS